MGYYMSKVPGIESEEQLIETVTTYSREISLIIVAVVIAVIVFLVYKASAKRKKNKKTEE